MKRVVNGDVGGPARFDFTGWTFSDSVWNEIGQHVARAVAADIADMLTEDGFDKIWIEPEGPAFWLFDQEHNDPFVVYFKDMRLCLFETRPLKGVDKAIQLFEAWLAELRAAKAEAEGSRPAGNGENA